MGGKDYLLLDNYKELVRNHISAEQEVLTRHFCFFGPVPEALPKHVDSEAWCAALEAASDDANKTVKEVPGLRFAHWGEELGPEAHDMLSGMTSLDPGARPTIHQVLASPWWEDDVL